MFLVDFNGIKPLFMLLRFFEIFLCPVSVYYILTNIFLNGLKRNVVSVHCSSSLQSVLSKTGTSCFC